MDDDKYKEDETGDRGVPSVADAPKGQAIFMGIF